MSNKNDPVRQHHVPKVYLKNFCSKDDSIAVLNKNKNNIFSTGLDVVAVEKNFYTINKLEDPFYWEKTYAQGIEPLMADVLPHIIYQTNIFAKSGDCIIDTTEKIKLACIMLMQLLRGKQARKYNKDSYDNLLHSVIEEIVQMIGSPSIEQSRSLESLKTDPNYFKKTFMNVALNKERISELAAILIQYNFVFFRIYGASEFITSDNPVMFINRITGNAQPFTNGLLNEATCIYYPISPKLLLFATHPKAFLQTFSKQDRCVYLLNQEKEKEFIAFVNHKQYEQSFSQVYASTKETLLELQQK